MSETKPIQTEKWPYEVVQLPSEGYFYNETNPLSSGKINLRQPTTKHEDILSSKNLLTQGIAIEEFLKSLIVDYVNYDDLLLGDIEGLMFAGRMLLYGPKYESNVSCPNCSSKNQVIIDLTKFQVKEINYEELGIQRGTNLLEFECPSGTKLQFSLMTSGLEKKVSNYIKKVYKTATQTGSSKEFITRLSFIISKITIDSRVIEGQMEIFKFLDSEFRSTDSLAFREYLGDINPGVQTDFQFKCNSCGHEEEVTVPIDRNFFWPKRRI